MQTRIGFLILVVMVLGLTLSGPANASKAGSPAVASTPTAPTSTELIFADYRCTTHHYSYCDRVECCSGTCLTCEGDPGDPFLNAELCEGTCYSRAF